MSATETKNEDNGTSREELAAMLAAPPPENEGIARSTQPVKIGEEPQNNERHANT